MTRIDRFQSLRRGRLASIEGLPLQLLIMIVIAAVGLGILLVWLNSVDDPQEIKKLLVMNPDDHSVVQSVVVAPEDYHNTEAYWDSVVLVIKVWDQEENPLRGCMVTVSGCGSQGSTTTDDEAQAWLGDFTISLPPGVQGGQLTFTASKSGYGDGNVQVPVIRGPEAGLQTVNGFV